jgi:hypothetical protein
LRTGSIGNRDAESLINTLVEPKKSILGELRYRLVSLGYQEETGYDAINVESYVAYSRFGKLRFILKHKWEIGVYLVLHEENEKDRVGLKLATLKDRKIEKNENDETSWLKLNPETDAKLIIDLFEFFADANENL